MHCEDEKPQAHSPSLLCNWKSQKNKKTWNLVTSLTCFDKIAISNTLHKQQTSTPVLSVCYVTGKAGRGSWRCLLVMSFVSINVQWNLSSTLCIHLEPRSQIPGFATWCLVSCRCSESCIWVEREYFEKFFFEEKNTLFYLKGGLQKLETFVWKQRRTQFLLGWTIPSRLWIPYKNQESLPHVHTLFTIYFLF